MLVVIAGSGATTESILEVLVSWSDAGLLDEFIFVDGADVVDAAIRLPRCRLVRTRTVTEGSLGELLSNFEGRLSLLRVTFSDPMRSHVVSGGASADFVLKQASQMVSDWKSLTLLHVIATDAMTASVGDVLDPRWPFRIFLVPEDRATPDAVSTLLPENFVAHISAGLASLGRLWPKDAATGTQTVIDRIVDDHSGNQPTAVWLARQFTRIVELPTVLERLVEGTQLNPVAYPNPDVARFERVHFGPRVEEFATRFIAQAPELSLRDPELITWPLRRPIPLRQAIRQLWAYFVGAITMKPVKLFDDALAQVHDRAAATAERLLHDSDGTVQRWDDVGRTLEDTTVVTNPVSADGGRAAEGDLSQLWNSYHDACFALVDGGSGAEMFDDLTHATTKERRQIAEDPSEIVTDPLSMDGATESSPAPAVETSVTSANWDSGRTSAENANSEAQTTETALLGVGAPSGVAREAPEAETVDPTAVAVSDAHNTFEAASANIAASDTATRGGSPTFAPVTSSKEQGSSAQVILPVRSKDLATKDVEAPPIPASVSLNTTSFTDAVLAKTSSQRDEAAIFVIARERARAEAAKANAEAEAETSERDSTDSSVATTEPKRAVRRVAPTLAVGLVAAIGCAIYLGWFATPARPFLAGAVGAGIAIVTGALAAMRAIHGPKGEQSAARRNFRRVRHVGFVGMIATISTAAYLGWFSHPHHPVLALGISAGVFLLTLMAVVSTSLHGWRLQRRDVEAERARQTAEWNTLITEATRRRDIVRLDRRLEELRGWNHIIGMVVHHPWRFDAPTTIGTLAPSLRFPLSVVLAVGVLDDAELAELQSQFNARTFHTGWLSTRYHELISTATERSPGLATPGDQNASTVVEGDTSLDQDSPRRQFARFIDEYLRPDSSPDRDLVALTNDFLRDRPLRGLVRRVVPSGLGPDAGSMVPTSDFFAPLAHKDGTFVSAHWLDGQAVRTEVVRVISVGAGEASTVAIGADSDVSATVTLETSIGLSDLVDVSTLSAFARPTEV